MTDTSQKLQKPIFFAGRKKELKEIDRSCYASESRSVIGGARMGKTAILRKVEFSLWKKFREGRRSKKDLRLIPIYFNIDHRMAQLDSVNILFGKILREAKETVNRHLKSSRVREELDKFQPTVDDPAVSPSDIDIGSVIRLFERELQVFRIHVRDALNCKIRLVFLLDNAQNLTENVRRDFAKFLLDLVNTDSTDTEFLRSDNVFIITCDDEVEQLFPSRAQILQSMPTTKLYAFSSDVGQCEFVVPLLASRFHGEGIQENIEDWIGHIASAICKWAGGHPELLERFAKKVSLEDRDIDASWIRRHRLSEHVRVLLGSCIQSWDLRARILEVLAGRKSPAPEDEIYKEASVTRNEGERHLEALKYCGFVQESDEGYILGGEIFRSWLPWGTPPEEKKEERIQYLKQQYKILKKRLEFVELELDGIQKGDINLIIEKDQIEKKLTDIEAELQELGVKGIGV